MKTYNKAYKYRLLPTREQKVLLSKTFGCVRFIWNKMLGHCLQAYKEHGKVEYITPAYFKKEFVWLKEVDSLALANVQLNLKRAFQNFFNEVAGFPHFKSKKHLTKNYTTNNQEASQAIRIENSRIRLPKLGFVRFIQHRHIKESEKIKSCTIKRTASGNYYISVLIEGISDIKQKKPLPEKVLGLDFSMTSLFVSNLGEIANYPRYFRTDEEKLHALSRNVSRKERGSNNYRKAMIKLARWHEHIANKRNDFLHKMSFQLAELYDVIIVENLNMHDMSQALNFGKSVADNGYGKFRRFLEYKLLDRGKQFIKIDKWFPSSKMCSSCGNIKQELSLSERTYECEACGISEDRDINAAKNIRTAGMAGIAW